ncbi:MAG TPA: alkaline phosphatase family protein [Microbacterium sp.]|uniref:phospholipase C n=1 Tax=Microbacterium sp. TaxID=51671 RepID=UPI002B4A5A7F|nr:alkaline phosphatase family protein [Microbacterium sp.]HKT57185.1 alkaline phosphatase family protein [Microbacterium sp.]
MSPFSRTTRRGIVAGVVAAVVGVVAVTVTVVGLTGHRAPAPSAPLPTAAQRTAATQPATTSPATTSPATITTTPIKHLVVIYDENVSYDHYFGTYPKAANTGGTRFTAASGTPSNNNLVTSGKLTHNPNLYPPKRLAPSQAVTCDQDHLYTPEQRAEDGGRMDLFVQNTTGSACGGSPAGLVMDYFDGNAVTGLWNYAQQYAMSDNSWDAVFGPSSPGAVNLVAGQTHGFAAVNPATLQPVAANSIIRTDSHGVGTMIGDLDPAYDDCSDANRTNSNPVDLSTGTNIGELLNAKGVTWGWFQGGFRPTAHSGTRAICGSSHVNIGGARVGDYIPHHDPFQYYKATANPHHLTATSVAMIGHSDRANHQYDLRDFTAALDAGNLPAVSFVKASGYQDGHAGFSDPIDEQHFLVNEINALQRSKFWASTAVVIAYDDSDGWYDHAAPTITNSSHSYHDMAICAGSSAPMLGGLQGRCGPSQRLPMLVISPWAKSNAIAHTVVTQPSILRFIEDNWRTGRIGGGSFDASAGSLLPMLNLTATSGKRVLLYANGSVASITRIALTR